MDKRKTIESVKARQIFEEIKDLPHPFLKDYAIVDENIQLVARNLRLLVNAETVTVTVNKGRIYVGTKRQRQTSELVDMIRKLAMHVDDERLYDEALALVGRI